MAIRFSFNEEKAMEALAFIAKEHPSFTPLYVSKVLFFAEKWHINRYGRPIIADTYIAMPKGPVPSTIKNFIDEKWDWVGHPEGFEQAVTIDKSSFVRRVMPGGRAPRIVLLSETDIKCLREAINFCSSKGPDELSHITHFEKAYKKASLNSPMRYEDFIDDENPHREEILQEMKEFAIYGVL